MENELFEKAPIPKAYFTMALPVVTGMVVTLVYNMVDTYFIARTGITDLVAGVSLCSPIFTLMIALGDILGLGGSNLIARLFGQQKNDDGKRISVFSFYGALLLGAVIAFFMLLFQDNILTLLGTDSDTYVYAKDYYRYLVLGSPFIIVSLSPANQLRTEGLAKESMIGSVLGTVINIILDPVFIFALGMGAGGAAIATVIGNMCTDAFFVYVLLTKSKKLSIHPKYFRISGAELASILAIGIPASITNIMQSLAATITNRFLVPYGNDKVAAMGIAMRINMICILVLVGFSFGAQPLIGYNYGAKNKERLRGILSFTYKFECSLALGISAVLMIAARPLVRLFMDDATIIDAGSAMLRFQLASAVFVTITLITTVCFQAAGKALGALVLSISRQGIIFILVIALLSATSGYYGVLAAQPVADLLTAVVALVLYRCTLSRELREA